MDVRVGDVFRWTGVLAEDNVYKVVQLDPCKVKLVAMSTNLTSQAQVGQTYPYTVESFETVPSWEYVTNLRIEYYIVP